MNRYHTGVLALLLLGLGCQSSNDDSHRNINDFTSHWVALVTQASVVPLNECLSAGASPEAVALARYAEQAKDQRIDIRFDVSKVVTEKPAPRTYRVALPFVLSGPVGLRESGTVTLSVQEDVFGGYKITDASDDLRLYFSVAQNKVAQTDHSDTKKVTTSRDSMMAKAVAVRSLLANPQDEIIYYTYVDTVLLFYVARGDWDYSLLYDDRTEGSYQLGVVDERGNEVIPVSFDKIYNPGGTLPGLIEVERDGKRGFYNAQGQPVVSVSFDAIYPYLEDKEVLAQVRFDGRYGWLDPRGNLHLNVNSYPDQRLFESPAASGRLLQWKYQVDQPGLAYLRVPNQNNEHNLYGAIFVSPAYLYDVGIVDEYNVNLLMEDGDWDGAGVEGGYVSLVESVPLMQQMRGLIAKFVEWGADARGYHEEIDRLIVTNGDVNAVATLDFRGDYRYHLPHPERPFQETTLFETRELKGSTYDPYQEMTQYSYYQISSEGEITALTTRRLFSFTKFIKINSENFRGTFKTRLESATLSSTGENVDLVISNHLTLEDLDVMRNEIFAEYGYRFKSEKWQAYFGQQAWYNPQYDNVDNMLTETDRYNIQFIYDFQEKMRGHESDYIQRDSIYYMAAG